LSHLGKAFSTTTCRPIEREEDLYGVHYQMILHL